MAPHSTLTEHYRVRVHGAWLEFDNRRDAIACAQRNDQRNIWHGMLFHVYDDYGPREYASPWHMEWLE